MNVSIAALAVLTVLAASPADAGDPLRKLAGKLEKAIRQQENKKVAVLGFPYHDGAVSQGSSIIQERMTTFLAESGRIEVIERNLLQKLLEEQKLEEKGLLDPKNTPELGKLLGVGAVVTGTLNDLDPKRAEVNARVIASESGKVLGAAQAVVERTWPDGPALVKAHLVPPADRPGAKTIVQVALLLDTSNSMDGLIDQAKTQLWKIVNELSGAEKDGKTTQVEVALYEYGNNFISANANYVRRVLPFTADLDRVSEKLFSLRTNGGEEFAGAAIQNAALELDWADGGVYKTIFIAGNEPFTQGPVDFRRAIEKAKDKGIVVNTIFCGYPGDGSSSGWRQGALAGRGEYLVIDHNVRYAALRAPQDDEIARLGSELNSTYVPYGSEGRMAAANQALQDANAAARGASGAPVERAVYKARPQYSKAAEWDVVSRVAEGAVKVEELKQELLPAAVAAMSAPERKDYIEGQGAKRREIQEKIRRLSEERARYLAEEEKKRAGEGPASLTSAMLEAVRKQASAQGYRFKRR